MPQRQHPEVLLVDPDPEIGQSVTAALSQSHYEVEWVNDHEKAYNCLESRAFNALVTELAINEADGMRLMGVAQNFHPNICVVVIADPPEIELATEALRLGAYDFQTKPLNLPRLETAIRHGLNYQNLLYDHQRLRRQLDETLSLTSLLGSSRAIIHAYEKLRQAAADQTPIILVGEPGTGKDLAARIIHQNSPRSGGPLVKFHCDGQSTETMQRELFGHTAGVFPASPQAQPGRVELADDGTLYLDSASDMRPVVLDQILETLQTRNTQRIGDDKRIPADIRLVVSVSPDLDAADKTQQFLRQLQEQFDAITIELPPLRERPEDIPILAEHFIDTAGRQLGKTVAGITREALDTLIRYEWPQNVTELNATIHTMVIGAKENKPLGHSDLPQNIRDEAKPAPGEIRIPAGATMLEIERMAIEETLKACGQRKGEAAKRLGIGLRTLYRKLKEYEEN